MKLTLYCFVFVLINSCSSTYKINKTTNDIVLYDSAFINANVGLSIFDPSSNKYIYKHNAEKYFVPASNTKILTCYAAMKYLGDSLVGLRYVENDTSIFIQGTGDPTFMIDEFKLQNANVFFQKANKPIYVTTNNWKEEKWGSGWSWTDFGENYCQERSVFPLYYNTVRFDGSNVGSYGNDFNITAIPFYFNRFVDKTSVNPLPITFKAKLEKDLSKNVFNLISANNDFQKTSLPFTTGDTTTVSLLTSLYNKKFLLFNITPLTRKLSFSTLHSQPTDSLLKPMMHRSDNFFAEQSLLMVSNEKLGYMKDEDIINYIKKNDFTGIPQMPRWVDGSGLSRYNMFTPNSIVWVLNKMQKEFGMERIKIIFATGGEGTLSSFYKNIKGSIFAKTGTLSNHVALSGFLYTKKGKFLIFSSFISGYQGSANPARKAIEKLILNLYNHY